MPTAPLLLSYGLRPFPGLVDHNHAPVPDGPRLCQMVNILAVVQNAGYKLEFEPDADAEDFWEDAIRIESVITAANAKPLPWSVVPNKFEWDQHSITRRLGPVLISETGRHNVDPLQDHPLLSDPDLTGRSIIATTYLGSEEFTPLSARALRSGKPLGTDDTITELRRLFWAGHAHAVIKVAGSKQGLVRIELSDDHEVLRAQLFAHDFGWVMLRLEGITGALRVSPWLTMSYEYRLFIVDGKVVTGAGCLEEQTPLDHVGGITGPFDPVVRRDRGNGIAAKDNSRKEYRADLADAYRRWGQLLANQLPKGQDTVVLDLAIIEGRHDPVIIEFNSLPNSGLYAIDANRLARALIDAQERGYWAEPLLAHAHRKAKCHVPEH